jgi:hypothetical protein
MQARMRRHTMLPNQPAPSSMTNGGTSPRRLNAYPSPPMSERAAGGVDIKKKPRAMSEMASEVGSMTCETCGKGYKHASCLSKHKYPSSLYGVNGRWEHSPHWSQTSKLLISKHQQVQLLEAAQILVHMNRSDSSLSTASAGDRLKLEGYNYPVVFEDDDDEAMDIQSEGTKLQEEDEEMFGMDDD